MPRVTVLMPLFNGLSYIEESLQSIQEQTFTDWEFIIVNDFGSDDGCAEVVERYAKDDPRIKLVQLEERLGLAASLNVGLDMARGEYVARVDVDDPSEPERLEKQVAFMDAHPELSLCSCWQFSQTPNTVYVQKVAYEPQELKAAMLFGCEVSHCGVMLRLADFNAHGWRYDPSYLGEDFELWNRVLAEGANMANIPEPLVTHRWGYENISIEKGEALREEVRVLSMRALERIGVGTWKYDPPLFSGWRNMPTQYRKQDRDIFLRMGFALIQEIYEKNREFKYVSQEALKKILLQRWDWIRNTCGFQYTPDFWELVRPMEAVPRVSVILPTFNSADTISVAIDSLLKQTYTNWELLVVNDFGSEDGTVEIVRAYAWADPRIRLIQAEKRLGLAESLNRGMHEAKGEYIARMDADDTSMPERFEKQLLFMDEHPNVGACGTWQWHYGENGEWIHEAEPDPEILKSRFLFWCDMCHSTMMLRKSAFIDNHLFYSSSARAEDHELWTRAVEFMDFANIPEVLGAYNEISGITDDKTNLLAEESGQITGRFIKRVLGIHLSRYDRYLLNGWINPISKAEPDRTEQLNRLREVLTEIYQRNRTVGFFDDKKLLEVLAAKWNWSRDDTDWTADYSAVSRLEDVFADGQSVTRAQSIKDATESKCPEEGSDDKPLPDTDARVASGQQHSESKEHARPEQGKRKGLKGILAAVFAPLLYPFRKATKALMRDALREIDKSVENWTWERYQRTNKDVEDWTWDRYQRTNKDVEDWTWDRYQRTNKDVENWTWDRYMRTNKDVENWTWDRYMRTNKDIERWTWDRYLRTKSDVNAFYDDYRQEKSAEAFEPYKPGEKIRMLFLFQMASFWPSWETFYQSTRQDSRIEVLFTLLDEKFGDTTQMKTARSFLDDMSIPYVEYTDKLLAQFRPHVLILQTPYDVWHRQPHVRSGELRRRGVRIVYIPYGIEIADTDEAHVDHFEKAIVNCWRIYTFSDIMRADYYQYSHKGSAVRSLGHPKFDGLFYKDRLMLPEEVKAQCNGRKIFLWHVHFPKLIYEGKNKKLATPYLEEYLAFASYAAAHPEIFFIFQPHPKFLDCKGSLKLCAISIMDKVLQAENIYIDSADDYRMCLVNADYIITDRSALMVESATVGVPVLFMSNSDYHEPITQAIQPLIESYAQGHTCDDMIAFVNRCLKELDPEKEHREAAFHQCIPYFDGKSGERIKEDIVRSLEEERDAAIGRQLADQTAQLEARIAELEAQLQDQANSLAETSFAKVDKSVERWTWDRYKRTRRQTMSGIWNTVYEMDPKKMQQIIGDSPTYSAEFYWDNRYGSISSAQRILHRVFQWVPHNSVVDFGCGSGTWLWVAQAFGVKEVLGIDGAYVPRLMRMIPEDSFMEADLENRVALSRRYDLAMTLEVAEHLSPDAADTFVASLCDASDIVLFSAAHPGQGGDNHINEQPLAYWVEKFAMHGYGMIDIRTHFEGDNNIETWYRQNIVLFMKEKLKSGIAAKLLAK